jgi:RNA polymerase sigma-70 factor, ECF subfamily
VSTPIEAECTLKANQKGSKRLIVPLRDTESDFDASHVADLEFSKKPASGALTPASDFRGDWTQSIAMKIMVHCQISPVSFPGALLGARSNLSATDPKPLASTIVRDDEAQLVSAAKAGDATAFEELVNRYERKIFRLGLNITQNREDAEDVMQEAFLKSYKNLDRFQGDSRFYTWLVRIAVNEALMKLRKRRPNQVSLDEPLTADDDPVFREIEDWGPSPEQRFAQTELNTILNEVIGELDPIFRVAFLLRDVEGVSTEETAQILGISVAAVKSRLLRARLKLRQKLNKYFRRSEPQ